MTPWLLKDPPLKAQIEALARSEGKRGYGFFMEMGLGKTRTVIAEWLASPMVLALIVPNSMKGNWASEITDQAKGFNLEIHVWETNRFTVKRAGVMGEVAPRKAYVFNFESIIFGGGEALEKLVGPNTYLAIDESVHVKNFNADVTKTVIRLSKECGMRRILSGNPRPESVMDLWSQLRCIGALDGVNPYAFRGRYAVMGGYMNKQVKGTKNQEELTRIMTACSFVAAKKDWADLPEKVYLPPRAVKMTTEQQKTYNQMWKDFLTVVNGFECSAEQMINVQIGRAHV